VLKLKIPDDIAVTGFDDIYLSRLLSPRLTTVHAPIEELGSKAVKYLLN
jgi:transcriptional regulator, LacI family